MAEPLATDSEFPIELFDETLPDSLQTDGIRWLRPSQIARKPLFFSEGHPEDHFARRRDVIKGFNGGFFLASVAGLTGYKDMFDAVVVPGQGFGEGYNGIFRFQFFEYEGSDPHEVQIDDRLPTLNGQLVFAKAPGDVFWCPLLEKAYAKFRGGYNKLNLGDMSSTLTHLTGQRVLAFLSASIPPGTLYSRLSELVKQERILCCKHKHYDNNNMEYGGSYTITGLRKSVSDSYQIRILDVTEEKEEWISFEEFKKEYDVVFATIGTSKDARDKRFLKYFMRGVVLLFVTPIALSLLLPMEKTHMCNAGGFVSSASGRLFDNFGRFAMHSKAREDLFDSILNVIGNSGGASVGWSGAGVCGIGIGKFSEFGI